MRVAYAPSTPVSAGGCKLTTPRAPAGRDIEEMVKEASVPSRVRHRPLRSVPEETQRGERTLNSFCAGYERHDNYAGFSGVRTSPFFNRPTLVLNPRRVVLNVQFSF